MTQLSALDESLASVPGTISVWCGPLGGPAAYERLADETHYAASTMKVAVLVALHRSGLDLAAEVPVHNDHPSALPGAPRYACEQSYDNDDAVWERLGGTAPLGWLAERMIVRSSNLATNLCLARIGVEPVAEVWRLAGATHSVVRRGIEDYRAGEAGISNLVTARDLALLLSGIARETIASPESCRAMLDTLLAQEGTEDLAAGLPAGTRIAHKNGWITGIRHGAGVVFPDDAPPYAVVCCATTPLATNGVDDEACALVARVAAASWADRHSLQ